MCVTRLSQNCHVIVTKLKNFYDILGAQPGGSVMNQQQYPTIVIKGDTPRIEALVDAVQWNVETARHVAVSVRPQDRSYFSMYHHAPLSYLLLDQHGTILDINLAGRNFLAQPRSAIIGTQFTRYLFADAASTFEAHCQRVLHSRLPQADEFAFMTAHNEPCWVQINSAPFYDGQQNGVNLCCTLTDITVQKQRQAELEAKNASLEQFNRMVAHDLKDPLGVILLGAELLKIDVETLPPAEQQKQIDMLIWNGKKANQVIESLLTLALLHKEDIELEPLDSKVIVSEAWQRLSYRAKQVEAELILPEHWPVAMGHTQWIEEIWLNYLSNALKYGGRPARVEIKCEIIDNWVRFWVCDNGLGLTPEQQGNVFQPFTRYQKKKAGGHGLGLSIVRQIVEKLGGTVGVEADSLGSRFFFTLPAAH